MRCEATRPMINKKKNEDFRWGDIRGQRGKEVRRETIEVETRVFADHWCPLQQRGTVKVMGASNCQAGPHSQSGGTLGRWLAIG